jgi:hypothetical protein
MREKFVEVVRANFAAGRITSAIVKTRAHAALDRFEYFFIFHLYAVQIGAYTA